MSDLIYKDLLCQDCNNFRTTRENKKGEKIFYCKACDKEEKISPGKKFRINTKIKEDKYLMEVSIIRSKKQNKENDRIYWDL